MAQTARSELADKAIEGLKLAALAFAKSVRMLS